MGVLDGVKVLELGGLGPGPFCGMMLADMGAEVAVIERSGPRHTDHRYDVFNRNKRSVQIDLKKDVGRDTFLDLVNVADMIIDPFRPGVTDRLGIGADACLARNPRIVYGQITGWGRDGPLARSAGHDLNYIALTGALDSIGPREKPVLPLNLLGDYGGGALYLLSGLLGAHIHALKTGEGQIVDAAMCDGVASLMAGTYAYWQEGRWTPERASNFVDGGAPYYNVYKCKDGHFISVSPLEARFYQELIKRLGLEHHDLPDQYDKARSAELHEKLAEVFATRTREEWCKLLENTDACFAPVLSIEEAPDHPHMKARNVFIRHDDLLQPAPAPRFVGTPSSMRNGPPRPGADTEKCLIDWGLTPKDITSLRKTGVIPDIEKS